jgi:collagen type III alpha
MHRIAILLLALLLGLAAPDLGQAGQTPAPKQPPPELAKLLRMTPDDFFRRFDKDGDGLLTPDEVPPFLRKLFEKVDRNGDGKLDRQEVAVLLKVVRERFGQGAKQPTAGGPDVEQALQRLLQMDTDKDGKISRTEARGKLAENFDRFDLNKDGYLDRAELRRVAQIMVAMRQQGGPGPGAQSAARDTVDFDALDRNADGRLTREEVRGTFLEPLFDQIDTNRDGKIDPRELETFLKKRQQAK